MKDFNWHLFYGGIGFQIVCETIEETDDFIKRANEEGIYGPDYDSTKEVFNMIKSGHSTIQRRNYEGEFGCYDYINASNCHTFYWKDYMNWNPKNVNNPTHYNRDGAMECIEEMVALFGKEETITFCKLNAWKYRYRAGMKNSAEEDMKKSDWYIKKAKELRDET